MLSFQFSKLLFRPRWNSGSYATEIVGMAKWSKQSSVLAEASRGFMKVCTARLGLTITGTHNIHNTHTQKHEHHAQDKQTDRKIKGQVERCTKNNIRYVSIACSCQHEILSHTPLRSGAGF